MARLANNPAHDDFQGLVTGLRVNRNSPTNRWVSAPAASAAACTFPWVTAGSSARRWRRAVAGRGFADVSVSELAKPAGVTTGARANGAGVGFPGARPQLLPLGVCRLQQLCDCAADKDLAADHFRALDVKRLEVLADEPQRPLI